MHTDARDLTPGSVIEGGVCIVGAGPSGITIAMTLAAAGVDVLLLEAGAPADDPDALAHLRTGTSSGHTYFPLEDTRVTGFGGTTRHITGRLRGRPFGPLTFAGRDDIPDYDPWATTLDELQPFYRRAQELCGMGAYRYEVEDWATPDRPALPAPNGDVATRIYRLGQPSLWAGRLAEVRDHPNVHLVTHATVASIATVTDGSAVKGLEIRLPGGGAHRVVAERYVLAAGGMENPRLLLVSRDAHPAGLGNANDVVGRWFLEHPHVVSGRIELDDPSSLEHLVGLYRNHDGGDGAQVAGMLGPSDDAMRREGILAAACYLDPASRDRTSDAVRSAITIGRARSWKPRNPDLARHVATVARDPGPLVRSGVEALRGRRRGNAEVLQLTIMLEQHPHRDSRVTLGRKRDAFGMPLPDLHWKVTPADRASARRTQELIDQQLRDLGIGRVEGLLDDGGVPAEPKGAYHHMGTTRSSPDPTRGVVDDDHRVHGVDNLWITGSSTFPTADCAQPTLTVVAMAAWLADRLLSGATSTADEG